MDSASGDAIFEDSHELRSISSKALDTELSSSSSKWAVWALAVRPDGKGFLAAGGGGVSFWDFTVRANNLSLAVYCGILKPPAFRVGAIIYLIGLPSNPNPNPRHSPSPHFRCPRQAEG